VPQGVDILSVSGEKRRGVDLGAKVKGSGLGCGGVSGGGDGGWLRRYGTRCEENENDYGG